MGGGVDRGEENAGPRGGGYNTYILVWGGGKTLLIVHTQKWVPWWLINTRP